MTFLIKFFNSIIEKVIFFPLKMYFRRIFGGVDLASPKPQSQFLGPFRSLMRWTLAVRGWKLGRRPS